jgi:hypothetical protein
MGMMEILANPHQSLVKGQTGFDADNGEIEGIGQADANAMLPVFNHALQDEAGQKETEAGNTGEQE